MSITSEGNQVTDSLNGKLAFEQDKNRIIGKDGDNTPRLAIVADGVNFSMKTSPFGIDVLSADDDSLTFNSDRNLFKIVSSGVHNYTPANSGSPNYTVTHGLMTTTIAHNLGYTPVFIIYVTFPPGNSILQGLFQLPFLGTSTGTSSVGSIVTWMTIRASADDNNINIQFNTGPANSWNLTPLFSFRYYLMQETAN